MAAQAAPEEQDFKAQAEAEERLLLEQVQQRMLAVMAAQALHHLFLVHL